MPDVAIMDASEAGMNEAALQRMDDAIQADILAGQYDGAAYIIARHGKVVRHVSVGKADLAKGRDARLDDLFCMMSLAKSFTAAQVLRLVDQGRLSLSTPLAQTIPEFGGKGKGNVTVFHALTHTGGIWSGFSPPPPLAFKDMARLKTLVPAVCNMPLAYAPGSQVSYCPFSSFALLGEVIVRLDDKNRTFNAILREDLFEPLGMTDMRFGLPLGSERRVPLIQREDGPGGLADRGLIDALGQMIDEDAEIPGAGAYGTAADVFRFAEMLRLNGDLDGFRCLSPSIVSYALRVHTGAMRNVTWDYSREMRGIPEYPANFALMGGYMRGEGFHLSPAGLTASPETFVAVGGGSTMFLIDPRRDLTVVYLTAGLLEGLNHFARLQRISDMALAAVND